MVFYDLQSNQDIVLSTDQVIPGQSTVSLRQLPNGLLVGGTSTEAPGGGHQAATEAVIYLMDPITRNVLSQTEIGPDVFSLEVLSNGNVAGVTRDSHLFIFDPNTIKVLSNTDVKTYGGILNAGQSLIRDKNGNVYLILYSTISKVSPDGKITKLTNLPEGATSGIAIRAGELYYASSSHLWKFALSG
jgi:outer membrane protein assembly factor BamB